MSMSSEGPLFHPEILSQAPVFGRYAAHVLEARATEFATDTSIAEDAMTVLVRTKNDADHLEGLIEEIDAQDYDGEVELVVVDTESTDTTRQIARHYGALIVPISQEEFTYPRSLNKGFQAAAFDRVFMTVGHANLSNKQTLRAVAKHLNGNTVGVYGLSLPGARASRTERYLAGVVASQLKPELVTKAGMGVLGATGAAVSREAWVDAGGYDERFAGGGEDQALAETFTDEGYSLMREPLLAVHHSHGLGPINSLKQVLHWRKIAKPQEFDVEEIASRRPDLQAKLEN